MTGRRTPVTAPAVPRPALSRRLRWLAYSCMALAVLVTTVPLPVGNSDTFVQIRTGEYIVKYGVPAHDPFSYTAGNRPYVEHEWLSCIIFFVVYSTGGVVGLMALLTLLTGLTYGLAVKTARCLGAQWGAIVVAFAPVVCVVTSRFNLRPHWFSSLFLATYSYLYVRVRKNSIRPRWLFVIIPIHCLWANMHGGHMQGLALLGVFGLAESLHWVRACYAGGSVAQALPGRTVAQLVALAPLCLMASLANPYGLRLLLYPFQEAALEHALDFNLEWLPPHRGMYHSFQFLAYVLHLGVLAGTWFTRYRVQRPQIQRALIMTLGLVLLAIDSLVLWLRPVTGIRMALQILLWAWLGLYMLHTVLRWRAVNLTQAGIVLLCVGLSLRYARAMPDAVILTFPLVTSTISTLRARRETRVPQRERGAVAQRRERVMVKGSACLLVVFMAHTVFQMYPRPGNQRAQTTPFGFGLNRPPQLECVTDFIRHQHIMGHVASNEAAWLIFKAWPSIRVNSDTRLHVYGVELLRAWSAALQAPAGLKAYLQAFPTDFLLLPLWQLGLGHYQLLLAELGWVSVYRDDRFFMMAAPRLEHAALIQREGYRHMVPWVDMQGNPRWWDTAVVTPENAAGVLQEAERALAHCPAGASFAWAFRAQALQALGRVEEARSAASQIPKVLRIE